MTPPLKAPPAAGLLSLSDYASVLLFIWGVVWGLYERAHTIRYFPPLKAREFGAGKKIVFISARVHPAETAAGRWSHYAPISI